MPARKRTRDEASDAVSQASSVPPPESSLLTRIRNLWQFANLVQWIYTFGKIVKIDESVDVDTFEAECLKPGAPMLKEIGLRLLQFLSSHRGLNLDLFDEYTRRQYLTKAPHLNPFGDDETPLSFNDFDILQKIKILQQMTVFAMIYSEKLREKSDEPDHTQWRIEPYGWDSDDRTYFVLDDNRLYRQTEAPPPQAPAPKAKPSKKTKAGRASMRASKRRRTAAGSAKEDDPTLDDDVADVAPEHNEPEDNGLGGMKWECIAVTLDQLRSFLEKLRKTRDENEKVLRQRLEEHMLPILEKQEASLKRKALAREKELFNMARMANAKRSSRIAGKAEQQRLQDQAKEEEQKRTVERAAAKKENDRLRKLEKEREERMRSRGDRLQERQARRVQHEEELAQLSESGRSGSESRTSDRRLNAEIAKKKQALDELADEEDDWIFDCVCGVYGQIDDGTHSISCERCNVWQHSACLNVSEEEADSSDFHFICSACRQREEEAKNKPRTTIKLKLSNRRTSSESAPEQEKSTSSIVVEVPARVMTPSTSATRDDGDGDGDDAGLQTNNGDTTDSEPATQTNRDSFTKNATLLPPPIVEKSDQPVIPVKKPGRTSFGKLPRPIVTDDRVLQTPSAAPPVNPLSSSPPMRLTPAGVSSPHLPQLFNGRRSLSPVAHTPSGAARGFPPSTPIMGGSSPNGSFTMATLPPSEHGISPTKHSPPPRPHSSHGGSAGNSFASSNDNGASGATAKLQTQPSIIPPVTTLVPSPPPQIMTPPHKQPSGVIRP